VRAVAGVLVRCMMQLLEPAAGRCLGCGGALLPVVEAGGRTAAQWGCREWWHMAAEHCAAHFMCGGVITS
jgi:hypothetical protein